MIELVVILFFAMAVAFLIKTLPHTFDIFAGLVKFIILIPAMPFIKAFSIKKENPALANWMIIIWTAVYLLLISLLLFS